MIRSFAMHRRFGRWLVGLYVLAIAGGFLPLVENYSGHGGAAALVQVTHDAGAHERHHIGDADDAVHHHVLQDLTGALVSPSGNGDRPVVHVAIMLAVPPPLIAAYAIRLERPPKTFLSI
jgi:hypothetical protein